MWIQPGDQVIATVQAFRKPPILYVHPLARRRSLYQKCNISISYADFNNFFV